MNKELLLQVRQVILDDPEHFDMDAYADVCGTTCCIAGHAIKLAKPQQFVNMMEWPGSADWLETGSEVLGIADGLKLFYSSFWPDQFYDAYQHAETAEERAETAARRIDHFIATEGRE